MVFSSVTFLFLFLPTVLLLYHGIFFLPIHLGRPSPIWFRLSNLFLLLVSILFYFWGEGYLVLLFLGTTAVDFLAALLIAGALLGDNPAALEPGGHRTARQKWILGLAVGVNLSILAVFKYSDFGLTAANGMLRHAGYAGPVYHLALPLGISFFIFHSMSYTIDVYRGQIAPTRRFVDYACYVLMFPQLVAGPIVRFRYVADALTKRSITLPYFASGVSRFVVGLGKKVLIANMVGDTADRIFAMDPARLDAPLAWLGVLAYTIQIYFDFSGYSDMAIGLGRMFGFELPINFNYPYIATSIREFWRRWHITLSTWFRDYLYIPLGGSRGSSWMAARNLIIVFFLCGLWHGAAWTFVVWGLYHGLFLAIERNGTIGGFLSRHKWFGHFYTLGVVAVGWVLFRAETFSQARAFLKAMAGLAQPSPYPIQWFLYPGTVAAIFAGILFSAPVAPWAAAWMSEEFRRGGASRNRWIPAVPALQVAGLAVVLAVSSILIVSGTYNPFIYFRF